MGWSSERIPIWWPPIAGEALDSWLTGYAYRLAVPAGEFTRFLGLAHNRISLMVRQLTERERDVISARTGVAPHELTGMTLEPWNGVAVSIRPDTRKLARPPAWVHSGKHSRYCPACLDSDSGRWQLSWRLPWTFACTRHNLLLLDHCPQCGMPPPTHKLALRPEPGTCVHGRAEQHCGFALARASTAPLPTDGWVLSAQQEVNRTVLGPSRTSDAVRQQARELAVLAQRALRVVHTDLGSAPAAVLEVIAECGGTLPALAERREGTDAHNAAVGTAIARAALASGHKDVFAWLVESNRAARAGSAYPITWVHRWVKAGPQVAARVAASVDGEVSWLTRFRYGTTTAAPSWTTLTEVDIARRVRAIPAMLWPSWTMRVLPQVDCSTTLAGFRRAAAALLLLPGSQYTFRQAAKLLGNTSAANYRNILKAAVGDRDSTVLTSALVHLARALDEHASPIDYERRRALFADGEVRFDDAAYRVYCRRQGGLHATDNQVERCRWRVRQLLLGAEPGIVSRTPGWYVSTSHLVDHELKALLLRETQANLLAHGIDEPVFWEPPADWLPDFAWPGIRPEDIDRRALVAAMPSRPSLTQAAHVAAVGREHIRLYFESVWVTGPTVPAVPTASRGQGRPLPLQGVLAPEELRRLYHDKHMSMRQIAEQAGCSTVAIGKLMKEMGIRSRRREGPLRSADGDLVTAQWLEREYVRRGRTTIDIGEEIGCHSAQVSTLLKRYGIPPRKLFAASSALLGLEVPLSPAMRAVTKSHNHVQRLRHLVQLPGHLHINAAAAAMGVSDTSVRYQLGRIEEIIGFELIERSARPLVVTPRGLVFLAEAERLLALLDAASPTAKASRVDAADDVRE